MTARESIKESEKAKTEEKVECVRTGTDDDNVSSPVQEDSGIVLLSAAKTSSKNNQPRYSSGSQEKSKYSKVFLVRTSCYLKSFCTELGFTYSRNN